MENRFIAKNIFIKKSDTYFKICHQEYQIRILARLSIYSHLVLELFYLNDSFYEIT